MLCLKLFGAAVRRRDFITLVGGAAVTWPMATRAQQSALPVIGFLHSATATAYAPVTAALRRSLSDAGYVEGQNVAIEYRWAEGQFDRPSRVGGRFSPPSGVRNFRRWRIG